MPSEIKLYNEDCLPAMRKMRDKEYDLAICDPPYGIKVGGGGKTGFGKVGGEGWVDSKVYHVFDDSKPPEKEYFGQLRRVAKNQIIWGGNFFIDNLSSTSCMIVWDKDNTGNFADCELAWTSFKTAVRKFQYRWNGLLQEHMGRLKEIRIHPTQKPVQLYQWLLKNYANPGDKILDTHLGSGSIAIACYDMGFDLTGYEIDKDYFDAAVNRLENHKKQMVLF